jgi:hypothetical protein
MSVLIDCKDSPRRRLLSPSYKPSYPLQSLTQHHFPSFTNRFLCYRLDSRSLSRSAEQHKRFPLTQEAFNPHIDPDQSSALILVFARPHAALGERANFYMDDDVWERGQFVH